MCKQTGIAKKTGERHQNINSQIQSSRGKMRHIPETTKASS